ncbi:hypothetical protein BABINDRAFT_160758 [Babjeviella inositovora NRRL Y-12698]|uniref:Zn(2)-C6 fungal-type domain-containing protein n=1 Tax=Babjeviella inositovora NRRL Y-12698 TaxID=984486 RepID=A0A1E3QS07_9ASCO|nr:uncharacterized protein BABINDRAFT_160758 [Babjeviella inositovora NRRL Y-12698]ODQ80479.1 hypothetical protein BABINDRAFT_160758 [Babjeviella inositovora NRRL Y-12698]
MNSEDPKHPGNDSPSLFSHHKPYAAATNSSNHGYKDDEYRGAPGSSGVSSLGISSPMASAIDYAWGLDHNDFTFLENLAGEKPEEAHDTSTQLYARPEFAQDTERGTLAPKPQPVQRLNSKQLQLQQPQQHQQRQKQQSEEKIPHSQTQMQQASQPQGTQPPAVQKAPVQNAPSVQRSPSVRPPSVQNVPAAQAAPGVQIPPSQETQSLPDGKKETLPRSKVRPCDHCRRRKTKCVIIPATNNCVQCETKGLRCTYSDTTMKRSIALVDEGTKRRRSASPADIAPTPSVTPHVNPHFQPSFQVPPNTQINQHPIRDVQPVTDYSSMPHLLLKKTLSLQYPRSSFYVGPTSVFDTSLLNQMRLDKVDSVQLSPTISLRKVGDNVQFTLRDDYTDDLFSRSEQDVDAVERLVAPHGQVLIDLYFRIIHPSFPILHKKVFLEKYSRTHREFSAPLLAAVYVLATLWWDYDPQLSQYPKPDVAQLNRIAIRTFSDVIERPKLSAVQAGLLLLQCRPDHARNWVMCLQVVALAEELGLGLNCATWRLPKWERGLRRRLAWAVFMQDKWLSLTESRPSHIAIGRDWLVQPVSEEDFPEKPGDGDAQEGSTDIENGKFLFREMISLSIIVSEILDTFFTMHAMQTVTRIDHVLKLAKPLQLKLRNWYHSLPTALHMASMQPRKLCPNGYLQLAYFATEITLHRKIITCLTHETPRELVQVCRAAAKTRLLAAVEFVRDLRPEHIHAFWHSSATANFALIGTFAAILFYTAPGPQEAAFFKDQIFNYRWTLRVSAKGFDQAASALEKLDMMLLHIPGLLTETVAQSPSPGPNPNYTPLSFSPRLFSPQPFARYAESPQALQPKQIIQQQRSMGDINPGMIMRGHGNQGNSAHPQGQIQGQIQGQMHPNHLQGPGGNHTHSMNSHSAHPQGNPGMNAQARRSPVMNQVSAGKQVSSQSSPAG